MPESPGEARLLRRLGEWGVPRPVTQHPVHDREGRLVGRLDVAWPYVRVGLEYDGERWHTPDRLAHDEHRHARLVAAGWWVLRAGADDLRPSADRLRRELGHAFRQRRAHRSAG